MTNSEISTALLAELVCPACAGKLEAASGGARCVVCSRGFLAFGDVACVMPDAAAWQALWRSRVDDYQQVTALRVRQITWELGLPELLPRTRARLERLKRAKESERESVLELFAEIRAAFAESANLLPSRAEDRAGRLAVLDCYENVFRDWVWGAEESLRLVRLVQPLVYEPCERVAVYGAGAGRFALELHRALRPSHTFALDVNPLPLLIAARLMRGEALELDEFPVSPTSDEYSVVRQSLRAVAPEEGLHWLIANALEPPFAAASLDAVFAPWFVDVCGVDLKESVAEIHRVLRPDGLFVLLGPLDFNTVLSRAYSFEEAREIVIGTGFEPMASSRQELPYFDSPYSGSHRLDAVYCIAGRKRGASRAARVTSLIAPWVENPELAVPQTAELAAIGRTSMFTAMVVAEVDGKRSITDIARELSTKLGLPEQPLLHELRAFMAKLPLG